MLKCSFTYDILFYIKLRAPEEFSQVDVSYVRRNAERILDEVASLAAEAGQPMPRLVAVTKSGTDEEVAELLATGLICEIGENRTDRFLARRALAAALGHTPRFHLIGSLQTNKVKTVVGKTDLIQSLDSERLAAEIDKRAAATGAETVECLLEVNSGREAAKGGVLPEDAEALADVVRAYPHIRLRGVMTMGPVGAEASVTARCFAETRELYRRFAAEGRFSGEPILSMGMSGSYRIAIAEGANMVRIGRAFWIHE